MRIDTPNWIATIVVVVLVPLLGMWTGFGKSADLDRQALEATGAGAARVCEVAGASDLDVGMFCAVHATAGVLGVGSAATLLVGLLLIGGFAALAAWAGDDRARNASVFPPSVPIAIVATALVVVAQAAIVAVTLFVLGFQGRLLLFVSLAGLAAGIVMIVTLFRVGSRHVHHEVAIPIDVEASGAIQRFVASVAERIGARPPRNVIVGLAPTFYAVAADVRVPAVDGSLKGETLYLSLPLLRVLRPVEAATVVGHELAHFQGDDTTYSLRFAPVYQGIVSSLGAVQHQEGGIVQRIVRVPAVTLLRFLLGVFAVNERRISRDREYEADRIGALAATPRDLAAALVKIGVAVPMWPSARRTALETASAEGGGYDPIGAFTGSLLALDGDASRRKADEAVRGTIGHPTDSHPPTSERLRALGVEPDEIRPEFAGAWSEQADVRDDIEELEQRAVGLEVAMMQAIARRGG